MRVWKSNLPLPVFVLLKEPVMRPNIVHKTQKKIQDSKNLLYYQESTKQKLIFFQHASLKE
jgi:hypothetical protein